MKNRPRLTHFKKHWKTLFCLRYLIEVFCLPPCTEKYLMLTFLNPRKAANFWPTQTYLIYVPIGSGLKLTNMGTYNPSATARSRLRDLHAADINNRLRPDTKPKPWRAIFTVTYLRKQNFASAKHGKTQLYLVVLF